MRRILKRHDWGRGTGAAVAVTSPAGSGDVPSGENMRSLDAAQEAKLDLVARKIGLKRGMRVLDIGCGWGGAAQFMAECYGATVTGVTVHATKNHSRAPQPCRRTYEGRNSAASASGPRPTMTDSTR